MSFSEQLFNVSFHLLRNVSSSAPMADGLFTISPLGIIPSARHVVKKSK